MVHCGYEPTAVDDTFRHPLKALQVFLKGPRTEGPMAPELPVRYSDDHLAKPQLVSEGEGKQGAGCNSQKVA